MKASPYLIAEGLSVQRGTRQILDEVSVGIHPGDRIGVVGRNGQAHVGVELAAHLARLAIEARAVARGPVEVRRQTHGPECF